MPVSNEDDFLTDLPQLNRRDLLRGRNNIFLSREEKLEAKLQAKMLRVQAMQDSIQRHQAALEELRNPRPKTVTITAAEFAELQQLREAAVAGQHNTG